MTGTREFYDDAYTSHDPAEAERLGRWRALGARNKADHAMTLCERAGVRPASIVEIGCGDGSLLAELAARGLAPILDGFEISPKAAGFARDRGVARRVEAYDGEHIPAPDGEYDLAVLSHVLEHVRDPAALLKEGARVAQHVLIEVPLEANWSARRPAKRAEAARIGHLHELGRDDVRGWLAAARLQARAELADPLPYEHHAFFGNQPKAAAKWAVRSAAHRLAPGAAERLLFTVHYAVISAPAAS
ncbi:MAG: class I SAM-dependent methyltransferase [Solirubrobacteraceae bacterium]